MAFVYAIIENKYLSGEQLSIDRNDRLKGGPSQVFETSLIIVLFSAFVVLSHSLSRCPWITGVLSFFGYVA